MTSVVGAYRSPLNFGATVSEEIGYVHENHWLILGNIFTVQKIGRTKKGVRRSKLSYLGTKIYYFAQETGKWGMMECSIY